MSRYDEVLAFMLENGVQMNKDQLAELKSVCEATDDQLIHMNIDNVKDMSSLGHKQAIRDHKKIFKGAMKDKTKYDSKDIEGKSVEDEDKEYKNMTKAMSEVIDKAEREAYKEKEEREKQENKK